MRTTPLDEFVTTSGAARILGRPESTIRLMARRGDVPTLAVTASGIRLFSRTALERLRKQWERADPSAL